MPKIVSIIRKSRRRAEWEGYIATVILGRKFWDFTASKSLPDLLMRSRLYYKKVSPAISPQDPIFNNARVTYSPPSTEHHSLYSLKQKVLIEPRFGFIIASPLSLVDESLPGSSLTRQRDTMHFFSGLPSLPKFAAAKVGLLPVHKEEKVVTLRTLFEPNYYHFYNDAAPKIKLMDDLGIDKKLPLVVSARLANTRFFDEMRKRGEFAKRTILVQDGFYIEADEIVFSNTVEGDRENIDYFLDYINAPEADPNQNRRIFLTRDPKVGRNISNLAELTEILQQHDFEVLDAAKMSLQEQMETFSQVEILAGNHGAGFTNMLYRRNGNLKILEIFPPYKSSRKLTLTSYRMAKLYGFEYNYMFGSNYEERDSDKNDHRASFQVDPEELKAKLADLI